MRLKPSGSRQRILQCLFREKQASRTRLAELLAIRKGTVGMLCKELLNARTIEEAAHGRERNVPLQLNANRFIGLGIDHDVAELHITALNAHGDRIIDKAIALQPEDIGHSRLHRIVEAVQKAVRLLPDLQKK